MTPSTQLRGLLEEAMLHTPKQLPKRDGFFIEYTPNPAYVALDKAIALLHTPAEAAMRGLAKTLYEQGLSTYHGAWEGYKLHDDVEERYMKLAKQAIDALRQATTKHETGEKYEHN